ncbi:MAG: alpha/beta fold hydrolase [Rhodocyclaceae bacterium]
MARVMGKVSEKALLLGQRKSLVGIMTQAAGATTPTHRPMMVILNAGIIHRVGPSRMNVLLARELAASGYSVLRFDLSGLGDSEPRPDNLPPLESALADIREVLDWLESTYGARRIVLIGLCSGANQALVYGGSDPRVVGLVLLDPAIPRTRGYYLRHYGSRLMRLSLLLKFLRGDHPFWRGGLAEAADMSSAPEQAHGPDLQSPEVRAFLERAYQSCIDQAVQLLVVLTKGLEGQHNYREQILDAFPNVQFGKQLRVEYLKDTEHTFTAESDRAGVFRLIGEWADGAQFPGEALASPLAP